MRVLAWATILGWSGIFVASLWITMHPPLLSALIGVNVTFGIAYSNRLQARRQAALDVHREYYTQSFSKTRRKALRFFRRHAGVNWRLTNPLDLRDPDDMRDSYFDVLRFWQRVATLYENKAIDRPLTQRLLAREVGQWFGMGLEDTTQRPGLYIGGVIRRFRYQISIGEGAEEYNAGLGEGKAIKPSTSRNKWVWNGKRWTTKGRAASASR